MPEFIKKLKYEARVFLYSRSILALTIGLLVWPLLVFFVDLYDRFFPILETEAGGWLYLLVGLSALTLAICFVYFWKQAPKASQIAQDVERANPALMDSLNCAVELEEKSQEASTHIHGAKGCRFHQLKDLLCRLGAGHPAWWAILGFITGGRYLWLCFDSLECRDKPGA